MVDFEISGACRKLLRKLYNRHCFGGKHTEERLILRSVKDLPKDERKQALHEWEKCKKEGLVIVQMKTNEPHASLNQRRINEIEKLLGSGDGNEN